MGSLIPFLALAAVCTGKLETKVKTDVTNNFFIVLYRRYVHAYEGKQEFTKYDTQKDFLQKQVEYLE